MRPTSCHCVCLYVCSVCVLWCQTGSVPAAQRGVTHVFTHVMRLYSRPPPLAWRRKGTQPGCQQQQANRRKPEQTPRSGGAAHFMKCYKITIALWQPADPQHWTLQLHMDMKRDKCFAKCPLTVNTVCSVSPLQGRTHLADVSSSC